MFRISRLKYKSNQNGIIQNLFASQSTAAANQTNESQRIILPKKIKGSPTDMLYTLSKTVGRDPTAVHYKYHDDPYLIPTSLFNKEQYALSQESGKQTAKWIQQQHAALFNSKDAQPKIEAFIPKTVFTEESEVDLKNLEDAVNSLNVSDAILIYRILTAKEIQIPDDLKQNILELVCFYNHNDPLPFDMFEERANKIAIDRSRDRQPQVWIENCAADQIFQNMEPKTPAAYNTMIRALFKHNSRERAEELLNEAKEKGIQLDLATYNTFIRNINGPGVSVEMRWEQIKAILVELKQLKLQPNVHTLNAILTTIKSGGNINIIQEHTLATLAEFKQLNIESSLETYVHLLEIFHGKQSPPCNVIAQILDEIEKKPELKVQSVDDFAFFYKAMMVCRFRIKNAAPYARRIDNIVTRSDNIKLLGDSQQEQLYYRFFLQTILHNESFKDFIELYDQLVPETYSIEPSVADDIFSDINISGAIQYVPKFWTDMVICGISKRASLNDTMLSLMIQNQPISDIKEHADLNEQFAEIAWTIYQNALSDQYAKAQTDELIPGSRLAKIVVLLLRSKRHDDARTIIENCIEQSDKDKRIIGCLTDDALSAFIDSCIENKTPSIAIRCIAYSIENGIGDALQYGRKVIQAFTLEPHEKKRIADLVGQDVLKSADKPSTANQRIYSKK